MIGKPHGSRLIRSGNSSAHTPWPSQAMGSITSVKREARAAARHRPAADRTARRPRPARGRNGWAPPWHGPRCRWSWAWPSNTDRAVRTNRATPSGWPHAPRPSIRSHSREDGGQAAPQRPGLVGQQLQAPGHAVEPVDARSALARLLPVHVPGHPAHLDQGAHVGRQQRQHPGPERRPVPPGLLLGHGHGQGLGRGQPPAAVPAEQHPLHRLGVPGPEPQELSQWAPRAAPPRSAARPTVRSP